MAQDNGRHTPALDPPLDSADESPKERVARLETELEALRGRFERAVAGSVDGVWDYDVPADTAWASPRFYELLGEAPGAFSLSLPTFLERTHPEDQGRVQKALAAHLKKDAPYDIEIRMQVQGKGWRWFRSQGSAQRDASGAPVRMTGSIQDIQGWKELQWERERRESLFRSLVENADLLVAMHRQGKISYINPKGAAMLGANEDAIVGTPVMDYLHPEDRELAAERMRAVAQGGETRPERFRVLTTDGRALHIESTTTVVQGREGEAFLITAHDVSDRVRMEEALKASERRFREMFENAPVAYQSLDETGHFLDVNRAWCKTLGYGREEVVGTWFGDYLVGEQRDLFDRRFPMFKDACVIEGADFLLGTKEGGLTPVVFSGRVQKDEDGRFLRTHCIFQDVTEQRRAESRLKRQRDAFESLVALSHMREAPDEDLIGFALEEAERLTASEGAYLHFVAEDQDRLKLHMWSESTLKRCASASGEHYPVSKAGIWCDSIRRGEPVVHNDYMAEAHRQGLPEGHFPVVRHLGAPVFDEWGRAVMVAGVANKPSDYSETDVLVLQLLMDGLWRAIQRRRHEQDLERALAQSKAAGEAKSQFLATMSHELRTPLNGVLGMLQLMNTTRLDAEQAEYVEVALASGRSLLKILSDILDLSRVEAGAMVIEEEPFALTQTLREVLEALGPQAGAKGLKLSMHMDQDVPDLVVGDGGRLRQILFNVVGNAVKFTEKGEVEVHMSILPPVAGSPRRQLMFRVTDTGPGVPKGKIQELFEPFTQLDSSFSRKHGGTGLGLSIVKRLVEAMGGAVEMESEPGRGTTVRFSVLVSEEEEGPQAVLRKAAANGQAGLVAPMQAGGEGRLVLIVEDDLVNRIALRRMLEKLGCRVIEAVDGRKALEMLAEHKPQLVFMDIQMPGLDGVEVTRLLRGGSISHAERDTPVVALTAHAMEGDRERFLEEGMDAYLSKPVDYDTLRAFVERRFARD